MKKILPLILLLVVIFSTNVQSQELLITIDGQKDSFYEALTGPADGYVFLPSRAYLTDVAGTVPDNDTDISAKVWFAYEEDFLYCYAEIKDDNVNILNTQKFQNDCLELKFDPDPQSGTGAQTSNCRITALVSDVVGSFDNINGSGHLEYSDQTDWVVTEDDYSRRLTDDGYVVEFRVPFNVINEPQDNRLMINREEGKTFGLAINIGDNDSGARDHMLQWSAGHRDAVHSEAKYCGSATFLANGKLKLEAVSPRDPAIENDSAEVWYSPTTGIRMDDHAIAESYYLSPNYPNPFNPSTTIKFSIPKESHVSLKIYNAMGQEVTQLISRELGAGVYTTEWNATGFASGIYYYQITAGNPSLRSGQGFTQTRKLVLLK